jgi:hypothetical protein
LRAFTASKACACRRTPLSETAAGCWPPLAEASACRGTILSEVAALLTALFAVAADRPRFALIAPRCAHPTPRWRTPNSASSGWSAPNSTNWSAPSSTSSGRPAPLSKACATARRGPCAFSRTAAVCEPASFSATPFAALRTSSEGLAPGAVVGFVSHGPSGFLRKNQAGLQLALLQLAFGGQTQQIDLFRVEFAHLSGFHIKFERAVADAPDLLDMVADLLEHLAQFTVSSLDQRNFKPGIVAMANLPDTRRCGANSSFARLALVDAHTFAKLVESTLVRLTGDLHQIDLFHSGSGARQLVGQLAVVGHQQQALAQIVQPAHGVQALSQLGEKLHHRGTAFGVAYGSDVALGLVQHEVTKAFGAVQQLAVHADMVAAWVSLRAELGHCCAVHLHAAFCDQFFRVAAAGDTGLGQDLLQTLEFGRRLLCPLDLVVLILVGVLVFILVFFVDVFVFVVENLVFVFFSNFFDA